MAAYYNEIEPFAAEWLRQLIKAGIIAPGEVDERSIEDVAPDDLIGFAQCHFFAGIGVWSYALRQAGWPDDRPVWTGSCPCQSFSAAGKGLGKADPRHLWPTFYRLIEKCRPVTIFGEQVEAAIRHGWLDDVQADLEGSGYACGSVVFPACGIGAPHIRSRLYWVADSEFERQQQFKDSSREGTRVFNTKTEQAECVQPTCGHGTSPVRLADSSGERLEGREKQSNGQKRTPIERGGGDVGWVADNYEHGREQRKRDDQVERYWHSVAAKSVANQHGSASPTNGHWRDADWLLCLDRKWRPVEPGTFPLVNGAAARVGRLRGYGNAIVAQQGQAFIEAYLTI